MLYSVNSPYYRQFLSSTVNRKYQKNLEKQGNTAPNAVFGERAPGLSCVVAAAGWLGALGPAHWLGSNQACTSGGASELHATLLPSTRTHTCAARHV